MLSLGERVGPHEVQPGQDGEGEADGDEPLVTSSVTGGAQAQETAEDEEPPLVARQAFVQTGRRAGGIIEIVEGLEAGQQVVTAGQNKLSNGARVIIDNTVEPSPGQGDGA